MKRNIPVLVMLAISMVGLTACQTKSNQTIQSSETVLPDLQGSRILEFAVGK